jgi:hypothetical protein
MPGPLIQDKKELKMIYDGKVQVTMVFIAPADLESEGDRIWDSHAEWMKKTHYREGDKALLQYTVAKGADEEGNVHFIVTEIYKSAAGHKDHKEQAGQTWVDFEDWKNWVDQCKRSIPVQKRSIKVGTVVKSLW